MEPPLAEVSMLRLISLALVTAALAAPARAETLGTLTQQGYLLDAADQPVTASVPMVFAFYADSGGSGTALWSESQTVLVSKGYYAAVLGLQTALPASLASAPTLYLGVNVGGGEMLPRLLVS